MGLALRHDLERFSGGSRAVRAYCHCKQFKVIPVTLTYVSESTHVTLECDVRASVCASVDVCASVAECCCVCERCSASVCVCASVADMVRASAHASMV